MLFCIFWCREMRYIRVRSAKMRRCEDRPRRIKRVTSNRLWRITTDKYRIGVDLWHLIYHLDDPDEHVQYSTLLYSTVLYSTVLQHCTVLVGVNTSIERRELDERWERGDGRWKMGDERESNLPWNWSTYLFPVCIPDKRRLHWFFSVKLT